MSRVRMPKTVEECHELIHRLQEENELLRRSASDFGRLAERLNRDLQAERRLGHERRMATRGTHDRRTVASDRSGS